VADSAIVPLAASRMQQRCFLRDKPQLPMPPDPPSRKRQQEELSALFLCDA
jgi:hypothetical protein